MCPPFCPLLYRRLAVDAAVNKEITTIIITVVVVVVVVLRVSSLLFFVTGVCVLLLRFLYCGPFVCLRNMLLNKHIIVLVVVIVVVVVVVVATALTSLQTLSCYSASRIVLSTLPCN